MLQCKGWVGVTTCRAFFVGDSCGCPFVTLAARWIVTYEIKEVLLEVRQVIAP